MSLYNKYRPKQFSDLIQNSHSSVLEGALSHHAYLLFGPPGTGKTSAARLSMASLNKKEDLESYISGKHPDYYEINCAVNNGVDDIRNVVTDIVNTMPISSKYKFIVFDEAHSLTSNAQNALLKTVEEPPEHAKFFFCTTEIQKVLPAIRSRCQIVPFNKISDKSLEQILLRVCEGERLEYNKGSIELIASSSDGSARTSINLLDQCSQSLKSPEVVAKILGTSSVNNFYELTKGICSKNKIISISKLDEIISSAIDPNSVMNKYADYIADLIIQRINDPKSCEFEGHKLMVVAEAVCEILKDFKILQNIKLISKIQVLKAIDKVKM